MRQTRTGTLDVAIPISYFSTLIVIFRHSLSSSSRRPRIWSNALKRTANSFVQVCQFWPITRSGSIWRRYAVFKSLEKNIIRSACSDSFVVQIVRKSVQRSNCTVPAQEVETFVEESQAAQNARSLHAAGGRRQGLHESVSAFFFGILWNERVFIKRFGENSYSFLKRNASEQISLRFQTKDQDLPMLDLHA